MRTKWAYKVETIKPPVFANLESKAEFIADILNRRGMDGWELVSAPTVPAAAYFQAVFKRPL